MNKNEFLDTLDKSLINFSPAEKEEIIYDYEEHFRIGAESGKTESELIAELGEPKSIAKQYKATQTREAAQTNPNTRNVFGAVWAAIGLGFFNLVIVLGPFLAVLGSIIALFAAAVSVVIAGIGLLLATIAAPYIPEIISMPVEIPSSAVAFCGVGTIALGLLFFIGVWYLAKYFFIGTAKYLKWNAKVISK